MDFNQYKNLYSTTIEESLRFTGKKHDFFTAIKANFLQYVITKFLPKIQEPTILDIGCGHGLIHKPLYHHGFKIIGLEMAGDVLPLAQRNNPNTCYIHHDGDTLPLQSECFDVVLTICVMHHVAPKYWVRFLSEMKRVVKKKGIIVIFEHNPYHPITRYVVAHNILDKDATLISHSRLKKIIRQVGFSTIKNYHILFTPFAHSVFRSLERKLNWLPLGAQYCTIAIQG